MDGVESFRPVKHGGGDTPGGPDGTLINRPMLSFRPIAPKPVSEDSVSGHAALERHGLLVRTKRAKRKYVRVKRKNSDSQNKGSKGIYDHQTGDGPEGAVVTLQLMPEKADLVKFRDSDDGFLIDLNVTENLDSSNMNYTRNEDLTVARAAVTDRILTPVVESWVVVESVTGTCMDEEGLGLTDMPRMKNLEADTCPGFISDGQNRVIWVNEAYKNMIISWLGQNDGGSPEPEVAVHLIVEERLVTWDGSFSCVVGVSYDGQNEKCRKVLPCDVWRMDFGGLAWRLDLKAALSLGALCI